MKIEKVNDNQIRCTLTREDLEDRHIKISELAYGSAKAKSLFKDMVEQANYEFGFETNDIPLMVEAIPLPSESIVLIITKVEYPDELDTRFSKFSEADDDFTDLGNAGQPPVIKGAADITEEQAEADVVKLFVFDKFDDVRRISHVLDGFYSGRNDLYRDASSNKYYLVAHKSEHTPKEFNKVCNIISEYAYQKNYVPANEAFFKEHGNVIIEEAAIQTLAVL